MAENEDMYLRQSLGQNICPVCQQPITQKTGTGQLKDGAFCSLDCYAKWNETSLMRRHQDRLKRANPDE